MVGDACRHRQRLVPRLFKVMLKFRVPFVSCSLALQTRGQIAAREIRTVRIVVRRCVVKRVHAVTVTSQIPPPPSPPLAPSP